MRGRVYASADNSLTSNAYTITGIQGAVRFAATEQFVLFAQVDGMAINDTASGTGIETERRFTAIAAAGAEYHTVQGLAFRLTGRHTVSDTHEGTGEDYVLSEIIFETAVAF
jgi:hypothetical protein